MNSKFEAKITFEDANSKTNLQAKINFKSKSNYTKKTLKNTIINFKYHQKKKILNKII